MHIHAETFPAGRCVSTLLENGIVYGHVQLIVWRVMREGRTTDDLYACIEDFWVHPDHRRRGYGHMLMESAIEHARTLGIARIYLTARQGRDAAHRLYKRLGFRKTTGAYTLELK